MPQTVEKQHLRCVHKKSKANCFPFLRSLFILVPPVIVVAAFKLSTYCVFSCCCNRFFCTCLQQVFCSDCFTRIFLFPFRLCVCSFFFSCPLPELAIIPVVFLWQHRYSYSPFFCFCVSNTFTAATFFFCFTCCCCASCRFFFFLSRCRVLRVSPSPSLATAAATEWIPRLSKKTNQEEEKRIIDTVARVSSERDSYPYLSFSFLLWCFACSSLCVLDRARITFLVERALL